MSSKVICALIICFITIQCIYQINAQFIGDPSQVCDKDLDCIKLYPNTRCMDNQTCACGRSYILFESTKCIPKHVQYNGTCEINSQCSNTSLVADFVCSNKTCGCKNGTDYYADKMKCFKTADFGQFCDDTIRCKFNQKQDDKNTPSCINALCSCFDDYVSINNSRCLKKSKHAEECEDTKQCIATDSNKLICASINGTLIKHCLWCNETLECPATTIKPDVPTTKIPGVIPPTTRAPSSSSSTPTIFNKMALFAISIIVKFMGLF